MAYELGTMIYGLLKINWVMVGLVRDEIWVWEGLYNKKQFVKLIPLTIFWVLCKEMNSIVFEGIEGEMFKIMDRWFYFFGSLILGHDIYSKEDFGEVIDILTQL